MECSTYNATPMNSSFEVTRPAQLSILRANLLYLVSMSLLAISVAVGLVGFAKHGMPPQTGAKFHMLLLVEILLILAPALIWLRASRVPVRESLRLRWPGWRVAACSLAIGAGLYPAALFTTGLLLMVLHSPMPFEMEPVNTADAVMAFLALAIAAPVCEEVLFRGVIQRAYEKQGPWRAILIVGLLFSMFHLWPPQCLGILPIVFALSYVYWRSGSLIASMLTHFGANIGAAVVLTSGTFFPGLKAWVVALPPVLLAAGFLFLVVAGAAVTLGSLWLLTKHTNPEPVPAREESTRRWLQLLPLPVAATVFVAIVIAESRVWSKPPGAMAAVTSIRLAFAPWDTPVQWQYELRNVAGQPVGNAVCALSCDESGYRLSCVVETRAYKLTVGQSQFMRGGEGTDLHTNYWTLSGLSIRRGAVSTESHGPRLSYCTQHAYTLLDSGGEIEVRQDGQPAQRIGVPRPKGQSVQIPEWSILTSREWPWRLSALPFASGLEARVYLFRPYGWRPETQDNGPSLSPMRLCIAGREKVQTPRGTFASWKVQVGDRETAWYAEAAPHTLLKYCDGLETWILIGTEKVKDGSNSQAGQ